MIDIERVWKENLQVYGADKIWRLRLRLREGFDAARCTVELRTRKLGVRGVIRGQSVCTTISDTSAPRPEDRLDRPFRAYGSNLLWLADFICVCT